MMTHPLDRLLDRCGRGMTDALEMGSSGLGRHLPNRLPHGLNNLTASGDPSRVGVVPKPMGLGRLPKQVWFLDP